MRTTMVLLVVACSDRRAQPPVPTPSPTASKIVALDARTTAADRLVDRSMCGKPVERAAWVGRWDGVRPFDDRDPLLHRGPTSVKISEGSALSLHVAEGVGAAGYELDLQLDADGVLARGDTRSTTTAKAVVVDGDMKPTGAQQQLTISKAAAVAACMTADGKLVVWRVLGATGHGVQSQAEADSVVLARRPATPIIPPPKGFTVLADRQRPELLALSPDDVVWTSFVDTRGNTAMSAIRAIGKRGGAIRELATNLPYVHSIVVRDGYVYYGAHTQIGRVALAGGAPETLVSDTGAMHVAVSDHFIAYSGLDDVVYARPLAGGVAKPIFTRKDEDQLAGLVTDGDYAFIGVRPTDYKNHTWKLVRVPLAGGAAVTLAAAEACGELTVDRGAILMGTCDNDLVRVSEQGGMTKLARDNGGNPESIAVTSGLVVYALGMGVGKIDAVPLGGGKVRTLIEGDFYPDRVAADPKQPGIVYVLDKGPTGDEPLGRIGTIAVK